MKFLDLGTLFSFPLSNVFHNTDVEVLAPTTMGDVNSLLMQADLVGFGGGADIHPSLYGCRNVASGAGLSPSLRDRFERAVFNECVLQGIPMFGICRGSQFVCAMSGGKLVQDVTGHGGDHMITTYDGERMAITSTHHQMMYPWDVPHDLIAWTKKRSMEYVHDIPNYVQPDKDPEIVMFPQTRALAVQGHPEWMPSDTAAVRFIRGIIKSNFNLSL